MAIVADPWSACQQQQLFEYTMDIQHVAGKTNLVTDCLSRAIVVTVHLRPHYASMVADRGTDTVVQAFKTSVTGLN